MTLPWEQRVVVMPSLVCFQWGEQAATRRSPLLV